MLRTNKSKKTCKKTLKLLKNKLLKCIVEPNLKYQITTDHYSLDKGKHN